MNSKHQKGSGGDKNKPIQSTQKKPASTPKPNSRKQAETKQLQEIDDLKTENRILRSKLDPNKIEEELRKRAGNISEFNITDELQKDFRTLQYKLQEYESKDGGTTSADVTELRHEVNKCTKEITKQQAEIGQKNTQIDKLTKQLKESENLATVRGKDNEQNSAVTNNTESTQQLQNECEDLKQKLQTKTGEINTLEQKNNMITEEKQQLVKENEEKENELRKLRETHSIDEKIIEEMKNKSSETISTDKRDNRAEIADAVKEKLDEINKLKNDLTELKRNTQEQKNNMITEKQQLTKENEEKENELRKLRETHSIDEKLIEEMKNKSSETISTDKRDNRTITKLCKEKTIVDQTRVASAGGEKGLKEKYDKAARELTEAKCEIDELRNRLSKVVGAKIMNDNPNIADLSDENRPTKLSEKYSELYDNEWTDAYEEVERDYKTEEQAIGYLYKTLIDIFDFCKDIAIEHAKSIQDCVLTVPSAANGRPKSSQANIIGVTSVRQLKELRKSFAPYLVDSVFQHYTHTIKIKLTGHQSTEKFVKRCVEICWLMNSQDPPVSLDTRKAQGEFDGDRFRSYTKTGKKFDFVVWPPMLLHTDGPMLCKGVAQGK